MHSLLNDLPEDVLQGTKNVGETSQSNKQLFTVTCVISWFQYCNKNKDLQQTNNFPNNYGHTNNIFHHYGVPALFVNCVHPVKGCRSGSGWMEERAELWRQDLSPLCLFFIHI